LESHLRGRGGEAWEGGKRGGGFAGGTESRVKIYIPKIALHGGAVGFFPGLGKKTIKRDWKG